MSLLVFLKAAIDFRKDLHGKCMYIHGNEIQQGQFRCLGSDWYRLLSIESLGFRIGFNQLRG
jgi:hypothetical protein